VRHDRSTLRDAERAKKILQCYQQMPRRCGPLLSPGAYDLSLTTSNAFVPPNILYIALNVSSATERRALVCVPAKAGSTSFYFWLYETLAGHPWEFRDKPWVQDIDSHRWRSVLGGQSQVARLSSLSMQKRRRILEDPGARRYALLRHPFERAESAYYSKLSCNQIHDAADHKRIIRKLLRQAPKAARSLSAGSRPPLEGSAANSSLPGSVPCLTPEDWTRVVYEALNSPDRLDVDVHFLPQVVGCGLRRIGFHHIVPLSDNADGMTNLALQLAVSPIKMRKSHVVLKKPKTFSDETQARIASIYSDDMFLLRFPKPWVAPPSSTPGGTAAPTKAEHDGTAQRGILGASSVLGGAVASFLKG